MPFGRHARPIGSRRRYGAQGHLLLSEVEAFDHAVEVPEDVLARVEVLGPVGVEGEGEGKGMRGHVACAAGVSVPFIHMLLNIMSDYMYLGK